MGYHLDIEDQDEVFNSLSVPPIIVNDIDLTSMEAKEEFNALITTQYKGDSLANIPSCDCGTLQGEARIGHTCDNCGTEVVHLTEKDMESRVWISTPKGVKRLINPQCWLMMHQAFNQSGCNLLEWLCNPNYKPNNPNIPILNKLKRYGFNRGLNAFYEQFDDIITALFEINACKGTKRAKMEMYEFIITFRDRIFCHNLQIPSKITFVTERTNTADYADPVAAKALEAIRTISAINSSITPLNLKQREASAVKAIMQLADYHSNVYKTILASKRGMYRKHVFGSRGHFTFRAVITSLSDNHDPDELHLPWGLSLNLLKVHVSAKLMKMGMTPTQAYSHIIQHLNRYCPTIDRIFDELIDESFIDGLPMILQRNPSLRRGSAQLFRVTHIKKDPSILTISNSVLAITAPNADYDGERLPSLNSSNCWNISLRQSAAKLAA